MVAAAGHLRHLTPPEVLAPIDEVAFDDGAPLSTNAIAQWGLAAIALLALLDEIPPSL